MTNATICPHCGRRVRVACGFCELCGEVFPAVIITREVAPEAHEDQDAELPKAA